MAQASIPTRQGARPEKKGKRRPRQGAGDDHPAVSIDAVGLKVAFRDVEADCGGVHVGGSLCLGKLQDSHYGPLTPLGAVHTIKRHAGLRQTIGCSRCSLASPTD